VALATASLTDGTHAVQARVTDATRDRDDANRTLTPAVSLHVDNTPPGAAAIAPVTAVGVGEPFDVSWSPPSQGAGSPVAAARWELISPAGAVHASGVTTGTAVSGLTVPADGTWALKVTLRDAAGDGAPAVRTFTTTPPESPTAAPLPSPESTTAAPGTPTLPSAPLVPAGAPATVPRPATAAQRGARLAGLRAVRRRAAVRISGRALVTGRVRVSVAGRVVAVVRVRAGRPFDVRVGVPQRTTHVVVRHRTAAGHAGRAVIVRVRY
jgi:hypothetical protein